MKTRAFENGYDAYFDHIPLDENPYSDDSYESEEWENGWMRADSDSDDET